MLSLLVAILVASSDCQDPVAASVRVRALGTVEISEAEADRAARSRLVERLAMDLERRASLVVTHAAPGWWPRWASDAVVHEWLAKVDVGALLSEENLQRVEYDHGTLGSSYRSEASASLDENKIARQIAGLRSLVRGRTRAMITKSLAVGASWVAVGLGVAWLDRLSRGYMTARLRWLGAAAGLVVACTLIFLA